MAKKSSAERVSPITRANYIGGVSPKPGNSPEQYDPLTELANMVGRSKGGNYTDPTIGALQMDMEAELFSGISGHSDLRTFQPDDLANDSRDYAESRKENAGLVPEYGIEPGYAKPVLQSFDDLHTAFQSGEPLEGEPAEEISTSDGNSDYLVSEPDQHYEETHAPAEASIEETNEPHPVDNYEVAGDIDFQDDQMSAMENQMAVQMEREIASDPELGSIEQSSAYSPEYSREDPVEEVHGSQPDDAGYDPVTPYAVDGANQEIHDDLTSQNFESSLNDAIAAEFEVELAGIAAETATTSGELPPGESEQSDELTLPPVRTPFDNQVDTALDELQTGAAPTESGVGWSGELAGELEGIVNSSMQGEMNADRSTALQGESIPDNANTHSDPHVMPAYDDRLPGEDVEEHRDAFEKEFSDGGIGIVDIDSAENDGGQPENIVADQETQKSRGGIGTAMVVLGIAFIGGGAAFGWSYMGGNTQTNQPVQVVMASAEPVKIKPKEPGGQKIPNQDQVVFEKVQGGAETNTQQETLNSAKENPIRVVTTSPVVAARNQVVEAISKPLAQVPKAGDKPLANGKSNERLSTDDGSLERTQSAIVSPRRVRTVIVRPDGSIVASGSEKPAMQLAMAKIEQNNLTANLPAPVKVKTSQVSAKSDAKAKPTGAMVQKVAGLARSIKLGTPVSEISEKSLPAVIQANAKVKAAVKLAGEKSIDGGNTVTGKIAKPSINPVPRTIVEPKPVAVRKIPAPKSPVAKPAARSKATAATSTSVPRKKPSNTARSLAAPEPIVRTASLGSYVMQISSQRSAEGAQTSYNRLVRRFGGILGGRGVDIRRFTLAKKGVYYRVRIPVGTKSAAINLCQRYKKAGGSCFVTK